MQLLKLSFLLFTGLLLAQQPQPILPAYLVRATLHEGSIMSGMYTTCLVVKTDGSYHLEKAGQTLSSRPSVRVFEGQLTVEELHQLRALLDASDFAALDHTIAKGIYMARDFESLIFSVYRGDRYQKVSFPDAKSQQPFKRTLKPFKDWFAAMRKRKLKEGGVQNQCTTPEMHQDESKRP